MRLPSGPLQSANFRLLLACDVVSMIGTAVAVVAIPFAVLAVGGSASDVGYVASAALVAMIVFLLLGGVVADRLPRHHVMMAADGVQALAQAASAALVLTGQARIWELAALAAVRGLGLGFYFPAAQGLLPQTIPGDHLAQANALDRVGRNGGQIGGAALGGILVSLAGPGWGLVADALSFALAVALRAGMRFPALPPAAGTGVLHEMREGWREFIARRWLWAIVLEFALFVAISTGATSVLGPVVAHARLGGARSWGVILAAYAIGAVLGGLVMLRFRPRRMLLVASLAVPAYSVFLFALAIPLAVPLIAAAALLSGGCLTLFGVNWATTMQQEIPPGMLSRLSSYDALGSLALAPVGAAVAGPLASVFGAATVLTAGGVLVVLLTIAVLFVPEVRQLRRQPVTAVLGALTS
ncbi:MAG TPA: MFS transporter [Streptosporangiaceae bacterium]|jgi:MFS family permease|nr:MFS transporter [Streptosporangiaceae bacterium]